MTEAQIALLYSAVIIAAYYGVFILLVNFGKKHKTDNRPKTL